MGTGHTRIPVSPEVRARDLEKWFVGHAAEIAATHGISVPFLRADTGRYGATLERQGKLCFTEWLDGLVCKRADERLVLRI